MENKIIASINVFNPNQELLKYGVYAAKHLKAHLSLFNAQHRSITIPYNRSVTGSSQIVLETQTEKIKRPNSN